MSRKLSFDYLQLLICMHCLVKFYPHQKANTYGLSQGLKALQHLKLYATNTCTNFYLV